MKKTKTAVEATAPAKPKKTITASHSKFDNLTKSAQKNDGAAVADKTKTSKKDKKAKGKAIDKNLATGAKKAKETEKPTVERESKYLYPADCKTAKEKKEFRRKARAASERYTKDLKKLKKATDAQGQKEYQALIKEHKSWKKKTYAATEEKEAA